MAASGADRTLTEWLAWQESLSDRPIELGLERVRTVAERLLSGPVAPVVLVVAGTNGKGSAVACLEALARAAGRRCAAYTSPHLLAYTERLRVDGASVTPADFCAAFARVEAARAAVPLTYFEFGTLAALDLIARSGVAQAILEVGLGGRLDAVNVVSGAGALITSIDLDHQEFLGDTREAIGREKAGVFRPGRPAVCADPEPPASVAETARSVGARFVARGRDFTVVRRAGGWDYQGPGGELAALPLPALPGAHQVDNAAGCLALLGALGRLPEREVVCAALRAVRVPGRIQQIGSAPDRFVDVGHNPAAGRALADWLRRRPLSGRRRLVVGMLAGKDPAGFLAPLLPLADTLDLGGTTGPRGFAGAELAAAVPGAGARPHRSVAEAWRAATAEASAQDLVLATGSFLTVEAVLRAEARSDAGRPV